MEQEKTTMQERCEICRRIRVLERHVTQELVRGQDSCHRAGEEFIDGWIGLCHECHSSVHRKIESDSQAPMIQVEAVGRVIDQLGHAFLNTGSHKIVKKEN